MASQHLKCCSLYKLKGQNRLWNLVEISLLKQIGKLDARGKTSWEISPISLSLRGLVVGKMKDHPESIMVSRTSLSSLVFSTTRTSSSKWLGIGGEISKIMPDSQYWQSCSFSSCLLDDQEKKRRCLNVFHEVFWKSMPTIGGKKARRKRGRDGEVF